MASEAPPHVEFVHAARHAPGGTDAIHEPPHIHMLALYDTYVAMRREWLATSSPWLFWRHWWWGDLRVRKWAVREASRLVYGQ